MRVVFEDDRLRRLYEVADYRPAKYSSDLINGFRKEVGLLRATTSEIELRNFRSLNLEKLKGDREGQFSIRVPSQWGLVLRFETGEGGRVVVIVELVDYH